MDDESELRFLIHGMLTLDHYMEWFEREVIGDLSNFKPIGILGALGITLDHHVDE